LIIVVTEAFEVDVVFVIDVVEVVVTGIVPYVKVALPV